jgi:invasion protein IalB
MIRTIAIALSAVLAAPAGAAAQPAAPPEKLLPRPVQPPRMPPEKISPRPVQPPEQPPIGGGSYTFSPWTKFCGKDNNPQAKEVCLTVKEARLESGQFLAGVALIEGADKTLFHLRLLPGVKREAGARIAIDSEKPRSGPFATCDSRGCLADFEVTADFVTKLKEGYALELGGTSATGAPLSFRLPLEGFAKAHEGPPTEPSAPQSR